METNINSEFVTLFSIFRHSRTSTCIYCLNKLNQLFFNATFYIAHHKTFYWTLSNPFSRSTKAEYRGSVLEVAFQISDVVKNYFILTSLSGLPLIVFSSYYQKTNVFERKIQQSQ